MRCVSAIATQPDATTDSRQSRPVGIARRRERGFHGQHRFGQEDDPQDRQAHGDQPLAPFAQRTFVRKVEEAIASGSQPDALAALRAAEPEMMRAAQNGIVHKNNASRKVSRLAARVKALAA